MRSYHEQIEVRRGLVGGQEAPEQFLWRDRLWLVREVIAHWIETGAWWEQPRVAALFGREPAGEAITDPARVGVLDQTARPDLLAEHEIWRVEAGRRGRAVGVEATTGVFDVSYDSAAGCWRLVCAVD